MWKKALLTMTVAGALAVGSTAAVAQTTVGDGEVATPRNVQVQTQTRVRTQVPNTGIEAPGYTTPGAGVQDRDRVRDPQLCDNECDGSGPGTGVMAGNGHGPGDGSGDGPGGYGPGDGSGDCENPIGGGGAFGPGPGTGRSG